MQSFIDDGYLVVPDLMEAAELDELKRDLVDVARGRYECDNIEPVDPAMSDQAVLESILCIHQPHYVSPVIEKYVRHPKICGALSQITAAHLPFWDGSVKCMQSMYFVKPPNFQGTGLAPRRDLHPHARSLADRRVDRRGRLHRGKRLSVRHSGIAPTRVPLTPAVPRKPRRVRLRTRELRLRRERRDPG